MQSEIYERSLFANSPRAQRKMPETRTLLRQRFYTRGKVVNARAKYIKASLSFIASRDEVGHKELLSMK